MSHHLHTYHDQRLAALHALEMPECDCPESRCCGDFPDCSCQTTVQLCEHQAIYLARWKLRYPIAEDLEALANELHDLEPEEYTPPKPPDLPTDYLPRTNKKVEAMAERAAAGRTLFRHDDMTPARQAEIDRELKRGKNGCARNGKAKPIHE